MNCIGISVNGKAAEIPLGLNVEGLLRELNVDPGRVAVELNRVIVRKAEWQRTPVDAGAQVEIVQFVGGG